MSQCFFKALGFDMSIFLKTAPLLFSLLVLHLEPCLSTLTNYLFELRLIANRVAIQNMISLVYT